MLVVFVLAVGWTTATDTTYFWMCAVFLIVFIYLDVKDCSVLLKMQNKNNKKYCISSD